MTRTEKDSSQTKPGESNFLITTLETNDMKGKEFQNSRNKKAEKQRKWRQQQRELNSKQLERINLKKKTKTETQRH